MHNFNLAPVFVVVANEHQDNAKSLDRCTTVT